MSMAFYNEIDPYAAQWLRNLVAGGHIAPGIVDERSIEDITPDELRGYTQCHFFAGIGVWSYALRNAGWPDDRPVWTGSAPCQPFSAAGKGDGFADERHLWPAWQYLIEECRPSAIFGEQVASSGVGPWIDLVQDDMEALGYAFGAVAFPAASVGAPHIRLRTYFLAYAYNQGLEGRLAVRQRGDQRAVGASGLVGIMADAEGNRHQRAGRFDQQTRRDGFAHGNSVGGVADSNGGHASAEREQRSGEQRQQPQDGMAGRLADAILQQRPDGQPEFGNEHDAGGRLEDPTAIAGLRSDLRPGPTNGHWADADWLLCRDGKWRPVEPGTFPLAHGAASRVGRLRAYGNAINAQAAEAFIRAAM